MVFSGIERAGGDCRQILSKVDGVTNITVIDNDVRVAGEPRDCLKYYEGFVQYSFSDVSIKSYIVAFNLCDGEDARGLYSRLILVSSPYIMRPLAHGSGLGSYSGYTFLACPPFVWTLSQFVVRSDRVFQMQRFTEDFIEIIRNVVRGLQTLDDRGFYCPNLDGKHIFIYKEQNQIITKIWKFSLAGTEEKRLSGWSRLGYLLEGIAKKHEHRTSEFTDLCNKLKSKSLTGMDVLRQSALLTVRERFENILALNMYTLVQPLGQAVPVQDPEKAQILADLQIFLQKYISWEQHIPRWMKQRSSYKSPVKQTGKSFIESLRSIIEHEIDYVPEKVKQSIFELQNIGRDPDLELQLRHPLSELYLEVQNFAIKLKLQY